MSEKKRLNWFKFWPRDWRADVALRSCSLASRGLWTEILGIMHDAEPYGHLLVNGKAPNARALAAMVGASEKEVAACLRELEEVGVFDVIEGVIVSRRMVRDNQARIEGQENGKGGGNPCLRRKSAATDNGQGYPGGLTPPHNPTDNPPPLPHPRASARATEAEEEKKEPSLRSGPAERAAGPVAPPPDARTTLFREGFHRLRRLTGKPDRAARILLGRLLQEARDDAALLSRKLIEAEDLQPGDPEGWLFGALRQSAGGAPPRPAASSRSNLGWMNDPAAFDRVAAE